MRLVWSERALGDLEGIAARAPRAAGHVFDNVAWLVASPLPGMFRRVEDSPVEHVLVVAPHVVVYRVDGDALTVLRVLDGRREL